MFKRDIANNVWHIAPIPPRSIDHPCPYPEEIVRRLVLLYSDRNDKVLDPFLGSGQTAIAARREGRVIGFVDGIGWYVRKGDLRRMVAAYEDVYTFHKEELERFEMLLTQSFIDGEPR